MRRLLINLLAVAGICVSSAPEALALPASGAPIAARDAASIVQDARIFCYNTRTGRFKHWGRCHRRVSYPRVYCMRRSTGKFLYWGACRR